MLRDFCIRTSRETDAAAIAAVGLAVWLTTYVSEGVSPAFAQYVLEEFTEGKILSRMRNPSVEYWVAEGAEGPVGFLELELDSETPLLTGARQAEVCTLYILERFTRLGLGRSLLSRGVSSARSRGAELVWLSAYAGNTRALTVYRTLGWKDIGEGVFELGGNSYPNRVLSAPV